MKKQNLSNTTINNTGEVKRKKELLYIVGIGLPTDYSDYYITPIWDYYNEDETDTFRTKKEVKEYIDTILTEQEEYFIEEYKKLKSILVKPQTTRKIKNEIEDKLERLAIHLENNAYWKNKLENDDFFESEDFDMSYFDNKPWMFEEDDEENYCDSEECDIKS